MMMQNDKKLADCVFNSSINIADGFPIFVATQLLGNPVPERITGIELMEELLKLAAESHFSVYFLGSKIDILRKVIDKCLKEYPFLKVVGCHHGYYLKDDEDSLVKEIACLNPDILLVALGLPQKEYFIYDHIKNLDLSLILPVGGGFDVYSGMKKRAPQWVQKMGIEWLWRSIYDRSRGKLIFRNFIPFFTIMVKEIMRQRILKGNRSCSP